jgi:TPP-dependent pyruvate/acetoin dehydrogenase alpha subunit
LDSHSVDLITQLYATVRTIRVFEETAIAQYRLGNIRGYLHPYIGEEAIAAGVIAALNHDDYLVSTHRGHGHAIAKGHDPKRMMAELFGKETGYCRGRGGSMHVANLDQMNLGANGIVGAGMPLATGAAMGLKIKKSSQIVVCFFSDGAANNGVFHESLNMAAIYELPVVFVMENNQYAVSTSIKESTHIEKLSLRSASYGMPGLTVEGNDALAIYDAMQEPIDKARAGGGPTLLEAVTYRGGGHHVNDPGLYMPTDEVEHWKSRDPLTVLRSHLVECGVAEERIEAIDERIDGVIKEAVGYALESPGPSVEEFLSAIADA